MTTDTKQVSHYEVISDRGIKFIFDRPEDLPQIRDRFGIKSIRAVFTDGTTHPPTERTNDMTPTGPLYINDNGMLCCIDHGGSYLQSEYQHAPNKRTYRTPLDTWEKVDDEFTALWVEEMGTMPTCELCR